MKPIIISELQQLLCPLSDQERKNLLDLLEKYGQRDDIKIGILKDKPEEQFIIDGHNRITALEQLQIQPRYSMEPMEFETLDEAKIWIWHNQRGRRNETDFSKGEIALKMKSVLAREAERRQKTGAYLPEKF